MKMIFKMSKKRPQWQKPKVVVIKNHLLFNDEQLPIVPWGCQVIQPQGLALGSDIKKDLRGIIHVCGEIVLPQFVWIYGWVWIVVCQAYFQRAANPLSAFPNKHPIDVAKVANSKLFSQACGSQFKYTKL